MIMHRHVQVTAKSVPNLHRILDCGFVLRTPALRAGSQFRIADLIFRPEIARFLNMSSVITNLQSLLLHLHAKRS